MWEGKETEPKNWPPIGDPETSREPAVDSAVSSSGKLVGGSSRDEIDQNPTT